MLLRALFFARLYTGRAGVKSVKFDRASALPLCGRAAAARGCSDTTRRVHVFGLFFVLSQTSPSGS
jgi:hypothetical protein